MKEKFADELDVKIYTMDTEEAKEYAFAFKGSTNVLFENDWVPLAVALDKAKMETFLSGKL
ncbi:MAG: hypothetical protein HZB87_09490 [Desulfatitalea sp.]|nr:hypothetical protein [Desulfatitalea sp.]MBI5894939.1 hypothetical protein [Desulfobacterales bacterium]